MEIIIFQMTNQPELSIYFNPTFLFENKQKLLALWIGDSAFASWTQEIILHVEM